MKPICPVDYFLVEIEEKFQDKVETQSGVLLYRDTTYHPEEYATITGRIVSVPARIAPAIDTKHLVIEGKPGDQVIFSYLVITDWNRHTDRSAEHNNEVTINGKSYWKVHARWVLGFISQIDGTIIPAAGYVYMNPLNETKQEKTSGGIVIPDNMQELETKGMSKVIHIGHPLKNQEPVDVSEGDIVIYDPRFVQHYDIKGRKWLVLEQDRIIAKKIA
jgi:co-chaperonin GroES (HSP10)